MTRERYGANQNSPGQCACTGVRQWSRLPLVWRCVLTAASIGFAHPSVAHGQNQTAVAFLEPRAGTCEVVLTVTSDAGGHDVGVRVAQTAYPAKRVGSGAKKVTFLLADPLRAGFHLVAEVDGIVAAETDVVPQSSSAGLLPCKPVDTADDEPDSPFDAHAYFGYVFDNFAPDSVALYRNPDAGKPKWQYIFGFDFDYHVWKGLWLYGESMHGVRSADIDCSVPEASRPPVCGEVTDPKFANRARFILEHATSLEAYINPRWEFATLNAGTDAVSKLYLSGRYGINALKGAPSAFKWWEVALGLLLDNGSYSGSYLEFGLGRNDLFRSGTRFKADALLSFGTEAVPLLRGNARFFAEATMDNDFGKGADAFRSFYGIDISPSWLSGR